MAGKDILRVLSCNVKQETLSNVIKTEMNRSKSKCMEMLIEASMTLSYRQSNFFFILSKIKELIYETEDAVSMKHCDYIANLLLKSKNNNHRITCVKYLIQKDKDYLSDFGDGGVDEDVEGKLGDKDLEEDVSIIYDKIGALDECILRKSLEIDLNQQKTQDLIKELLISLENEDLSEENIENVFFFMENIPVMQNTLLFTMLYSVIEFDGREEEDNLKELKKITPTISAKISGGWTQPSSLLWIKGTNIFFEKNKTPKPEFGEGDEPLEKIWKTMVKNAEICIVKNDEVENELANFDSEKSKKKSVKSNKMTYDPSFYNSVWSEIEKDAKLSKMFSGNKMNFTCSLAGEGGMPTKGSKYECLIPYFEKYQNTMKTKEPAKSKSSKGPSVLDSLEELSEDCVQFGVPTPEFHSTSIHAAIMADETCYIGKCSSTLPNMNYHKFLNWVKELFGLETRECKLFKIEGKFTMESEEKGKKNSKKQLTVSRKGEERTVWSIWGCYEDSDAQKISMDTFKDDKDLRKTVIKLALIKWLFSAGNTTFDNIHHKIVDGESKVLSFWDYKNEIPKNETCLKGFMKNENTLNETKEVYLEVVDEVAEVFDKNSKEIIDKMRKNATNTSCIALESKIQSGYGEKDREIKDLINDVIEKEFDESLKAIAKSRDKPKK